MARFSHTYLWQCICFNYVNALSIKYAVNKSLNQEVFLTSNFKSFYRRKWQMFPYPFHIPQPVQSLPLIYLKGEIGTPLRLSLLE